MTGAASHSSTKIRLDAGMEEEVGSIVGSYGGAESSRIFESVQISMRIKFVKQSYYIISYPFFLQFACDG